MHKCYDMFENGLDEIEFKLLKFGKLTSGTARNAISAGARLEGSLRCFSEEHSAFLRSRINDVAMKVQKETGTEFEISYSDGYLPVRNDPELFGLVSETLGDVLYGQAVHDGGGLFILSGTRAGSIHVSRLR